MNRNQFLRTIELSKSDKKTLEEKTLKLMEETGELAKCVLSTEKAHCCSNMYTKNDIIIEAVDTIQCSLSIIADLLKTDDIIQQYEKIYTEKLDQWEKKQRR